jgi:hypothetical protein
VGARPQPVTGLLPIASKVAVGEALEPTLADLAEMLNAGIRLANPPRGLQDGYHRLALFQEDPCF